MSKKVLAGFDTLSKGVFENSGANLYVSKKGVLQRIWRFDVNNDGYVDLAITNSHDYNEHPDVYIYRDPLGENDLLRALTVGSQTGCVADINGDGYSDLIVAAIHDGQHTDLPSYLYMGGSDGITENRKLDLAAPACHCARIGKFHGGDKLEICYMIADGIDASGPAGLHNHRLRVYSQLPTGGFGLGIYKDYPVESCRFTVFDIDGDGCDDLYCRGDDGKWFILWGGSEGFSMNRSTLVGPTTNDRKRFNILPSGGGNIPYAEYTRSKVLTLGGKNYLFYADAGKVRLIEFNGREPSGNEIVIPVANVISAEAGHIRSKDTDDLVLVQINSLEDQKMLVYAVEKGFDEPIYTAPVMTPRDVKLFDLNDNGHDDIVVVQGRDLKSHTTKSLVFAADATGTLAAEPLEFETHNAVETYVGDFDGSGKKSLVFINQQQSTAYGHIPVYVYMGSENGFTPENRLEFPGHSAGTIIPVDFNDDGWPDILVLQNAEDQPHLRPDGDIYWGGPEGFSLDKCSHIPAPLAWGGHCADLNKDGYLDIISTGDTEGIRIFYGSAEGYLEENMKLLDVRDDKPGSHGILWPALADLNGDGWLDMVVPVSWRNFSRIYWGGPDGFTPDNYSELPIENGLTVRVADLNKDGYPDLVFGSRASYHRDVYQEGSVTIFWGSEKGYSGFNCCSLQSYQSNNITIADLNNDGYLDIFASSYFNKKERDINCYIYWNDKGHFSATNRKRIFAHSSSAAWACDFNEDGYVDLCVTNHRAYGNHRTESAIWWNGPEGFSEDRRSWLPTIGPHDMVATDVGNIMTRGPEEWYMTSAQQMDGIKNVSWTGDVPAKTWVNCQIRTAATAEDLEKAEFAGPDGTAASRFECGQEIPAELVKGAYVQVKLFLGAVNSGNSPRITEISLND